jgi:glycosyltransferase involved in cell wall biosynthesis
LNPSPVTSNQPLRLLSVIIPARDEEGCIASTVEHLHLELELRGVPHEIIVVDDGSTDRTWQILQEQAARLNSRSPTFPPSHLATFATSAAADSSSSEPPPCHAVDAQREGESPAPCSNPHASTTRHSPQRHQRARWTSGLKSISLAATTKSPPYEFQSPPRFSHCSYPLT